MSRVLLGKFANRKVLHKCDSTFSACIHFLVFRSSSKNLVPAGSGLFANANHSRSSALCTCWLEKLIKARSLKTCKRSDFIFLSKTATHSQLGIFFNRHYCTDMSENKYVVGYAKLGTSSCKKCKQKIDKGALRIGKVVSNPFGGDGGDMKQWFHPSCIFDTFLRARAATKKIEDPDDVEGFEELKQEDKDVINEFIKGKFNKLFKVIQFLYFGILFELFCLVFFFYFSCKKLSDHITST